METREEMNKVKGRLCTTLNDDRLHWSGSGGLLSDAILPGSPIRGILDGFIAKIVTTVLSDISGVDYWKWHRLLQIVLDAWDVWDIWLRG